MCTFVMYSACFFCVLFHYTVCVSLPATCVYPPAVTPLLSLVLLKFDVLVWLVVLDVDVGVAVLLFVGVRVLLVVGVAVLLALGVAVLLALGVAVLLAGGVAVLLARGMTGTSLILNGLLSFLPAELTATALME